MKKVESFLLLEPVPESFAMDAPHYVLLVSSDDDVTSEVRDLLTRKRDCSLRIVRESEDVVLSVLEEDIDVVVIDLDSQGSDESIKVIKIIERCRPRVPIVVVSGDPSIETGSEVVQLGVFYYLLKPLEWGTFSQVLDSAFRKKEMEDRR